MTESNKIKTSNVAGCLKAIAEYVGLDEKNVNEQERTQLKDKAKKAVEHLSALFSPGTEAIYLEGCPEHQRALLL